MFPLHPRLSSMLRTANRRVCICIFPFFLCAVVFLRPTDPILESRENHHHLLRPSPTYIGTTTSSFSPLCISSFAGWCDFYDDYFACASLTFNLLIFLYFFSFALSRVSFYCHIFRLSPVSISFCTAFLSNLYCTCKRDTR